MVRWTAFWTAALPCNKKGFSFKDIKLPYDKVEPKIIGKTKVMTRDELRESYRKSGFIISENKLSEMTK